MSLAQAQRRLAQHPLGDALVRRAHAVVAHAGVVPDQPVGAHLGLVEEQSACAPVRSMHARAVPAGAPYLTQMGIRHAAGLSERAAPAGA